ncbi:1822_t:CDS:2 [Scutellospora calospora]|uniref:1822_t:CDS:1 n=1 Tax=Scutellospora calospora TaxID=85575 RepID=A0ACA9JU59_9GLOM|nr:1822_t:CDS:2 [Scutellospora calospora]
MSVITVINNHEFFLSIVNNPSNPLQPDFLCSVEEKFSDVQNTPSKAINLLYWELFGGQTEHSGLAVFGFYNKEIILEIPTDISFFPLFIKVDKFSIVVSKIGYSSREDLLYAGPGYTSSLLTCRGSETYLILQQVLDNYCSLRVYKGRNEVYQYVGEIPIIVWKKYGMHQNRDHLALFGLKDPKVQSLLTNKKEDITCEDIVEAAKGLSGTSLAEIKINRDDRKFNASLIHPKPIVSAHTEPISDWTMPIPTIKVPSNNVISEDIEMEDVINFNDEEDYSEIDIEENDAGEQDAFIHF